jgi:membrane protease YdiL (CAAX protease family)
MSFIVLLNPPLQFDLPGNNQWWRFALSIVIFIGGYVAVNLTLVYGAQYLHGTLYQLFPNTFSSQPIFHLFDMKKGWPDAPVMSGVVLFILFMLSLVVAIPILGFVIRVIHGRPVKSVFGNLGQGFDWALFWSGFLSAALALSIVTGIELLMFWDLISYQPDWHALFIYVPVALVLVPLQVLAEEMMFRGYLLQMVCLSTRRFLIRLLVPALPFALLHYGNAEVQNAPVMALSYFIILSSYLTWLSLRTGGLAAAVGFHLAMNLFAMFVLSSSLSAYISPAVFYSETSIAEALPVEIIVIIVLFHFVMRRRGVV